MIHVICTGKGTHRELSMDKQFDFGKVVARLTKNSQLDSDGRFVQARYDAWFDVNFPEQPLADGYTFTCRRCTPVRHTEMKKKTLTKALDGVQAAGRQTLDISALPF